MFANFLYSSLTKVNDNSKLVGIIYQLLFKPEDILFFPS